MSIWSSDKDGNHIPPKSQKQKISGVKSSPDSVGIVKHRYLKRNNDSLRRIKNPNRYSYQRQIKTSEDITNDEIRGKAERELVGRLAKKGDKKSFEFWHGIISGFPLCCIDYYNNVWTDNLAEKLRDDFANEDGDIGTIEASHKRTNHVMCPDCLISHLNSKTGKQFLKRNESSSEFFFPTADQALSARRSWDELRPIQRRELIEMSLSDEEKDNPLIHETTDYITFRNFEELSPTLQKSIIFMIGGK